MFSSLVPPFYLTFIIAFWGLSVGALYIGLFAFSVLFSTFYLVKIGGVLTIYMYFLLAVLCYFVLWRNCSFFLMHMFQKIFITLSPLIVLCLGRFLGKFINFSVPNYSMCKNYISHKGSHVLRTTALELLGGNNSSGFSALSNVVFFRTQHFFCNELNWCFADLSKNGIILSYKSSSSFVRFYFYNFFSSKMPECVKFSKKDCVWVLNNSLNVEIYSQCNYSKNMNFSYSPVFFVMSENFIVGGGSHCSEFGLAGDFLVSSYFDLYFGEKLRLFKKNLYFHSPNYEFRRWFTRVTLFNKDSLLDSRALYMLREQQFFFKLDKAGLEPSRANLTLKKKHRNLSRPEHLP